jgi:hypothetical protein
MSPESFNPSICPCIWLYSFVTYQVLGAGTIEEFLTMYRTFSRHELTRRDAGQERKEKKRKENVFFVFCHAVSVVGVLKPGNLQRQARDRNMKNSKKVTRFVFAGEIAESLHPYAYVRQGVPYADLSGDPEAWATHAMAVRKTPFVWTQF